MDITPRTNLLNSLRGERVDYGLLAGEGIDNAFDAGAKNCSITINQQLIRIEDDGIGITRDRIGALFSLGEHGPMSGRRLGRFGIGIKSQAVNAGDVLTIDSTSTDGRVVAEVDWARVLKGSRWVIDDPMWLPHLVDAPTGTRIEISKLRSAPSTPLSRIEQEIAERFYPALREGRTITFNGHPVPLLPDPKMTDAVEANLSLSNGRNAFLRGGILVSANRLNSVHIGYLHRVIMPGCSLGCRDYAGIKKLFVRVLISGPWHLAKFKNDLTDEDERNELDEAIFSVIEPLLEKASAQSFDVRINELTSRINACLPEELAAARPRRKEDKEKSKGTKSTRIEREIKPEHAKPEASGPAKTRRAKDRLLVTLDGIAEQDGVGSYSPGRPHRVNLSRDDPWVAAFVNAKDIDLAGQALMGMAVAIYLDGRKMGAEPELELDAFGVAISRLIAAQDNDAAEVGS